MKAILYNRQGEITEDHTKAIGALFEGNDAVESNVIIKDDEPADIDHMHFCDTKNSVYSCVMKENNISIFIDPISKIFNVISRSDMEDGKNIGTCVSFTNDDFDKFIELMKKVVDPSFGSKIRKC